MIQEEQKQLQKLEQAVNTLKKINSMGIEDLLEKLKQEIADLKRRNTELEQLSLTEDHIHSLQSFQSLSVSSGSEDSSSISVHHHLSFDGLQQLLHSSQNQRAEKIFYSVYYCKVRFLLSSSFVKEHIELNGLDCPLFQCPWFQVWVDDVKLRPGVRYVDIISYLDFSEGVVDEELRKHKCTEACNDLHSDKTARVLCYSRDQFIFLKAEAQPGQSVGTPVYSAWVTVQNNGVEIAGRSCSHIAAVLWNIGQGF
ncbi:hypothetical protein MHYP_G00090250 [Metynnis hypsauchen]